MFIGNYNTPLSRITASITASKYNIDNTPQQEQLDNIERLILNIYDPIIEEFGYPPFISSGFRSETLNQKITKNLNSKSQHQKGEAIDLDTQVDQRGVTNKEIFNFIKNNLIFDQLIWEYGSYTEPDWVHVSYSLDNNRNEILRAIKGKGYVFYEQPNIIYKGFVSI